MKSLCNLIRKVAKTHLVDNLRDVYTWSSCKLVRRAALMLAMEYRLPNATVAACHTKTLDMPSIVREADIVIVAAGRMETIGAECFKSGQIVLDVGIGWSEEKQKLCGDVRFDEVEPVVAAITPVPGGVGGVTTAVLVSHVVESAKRLLR